ncbi:CD1845 family protein [Peptostreptococcus stomatis]|uniref:CD1845 family protein n=1 Tax=Peptostreptococcus stomatis TaxID=341694 RepID=UPI003993447F
MHIWGVSFFHLRRNRNRYIGLVIGFLFSPYGLPMIGATVIAFIELINDTIKSM